VFSHGKGTIEDNVKAAREAGLRRVGISDHGPGHVFFGIRRDSIPEMRAETDRLKAAYPDIDVVLGVEANIINRSGRLDILSEEFPLFDYVIAGYHYGVLGEEPWRSAAGAFRNMASRPGGRRAARLMAENTAMVEKAIYENDIMMLAHPGDKCPVDLRAVAEACAKTGALFELNSWHGGLTAADVKTAAAAGARFAISSDAHTPGRVGDFGPALALALGAGIDMSLVVNLEEVKDEDGGRESGSAGGAGAARGGISNWTS
jgi:putative hydrolase